MRNPINVVEMRKDLLRMGLASKSAGAHLGGSLSLVEIMAALYGGVMNYEVDDPKRDRLIFSKGHGVMAQYVALKQVGLMTDEEILSYKQTGSIASAHPSIHQSRLGIDFASGSLGQGLSLGVGTCLALRRKNIDSRVFVVLGDGECDEGSVWEAAESAAHYSLSNLVAIIDMNGLQYDGPTDGVLQKGDFASKWCSFGWDAIDVDGHDLSALTEALAKKNEHPLAIIAHTKKGKGISFMEMVPSWHHNIVTQKVYDQAMAELEVQS